jgi:hypothetical protein
MPAAEGAVAAAAVADQMYGPKEDRKLAIVLVNLVHLECSFYLGNYDPVIVDYLNLKLHKCLPFLQNCHFLYKI